MNGHDLVVVYVSSGPLAAEVIKGKLESAGIPAMVKSDAQGPFVFAVGKMGQVEVLVSKENEEQARALIERGESEGES